MRSTSISMGSYIGGWWVTPLLGRGRYLHYHGAWFGPSPTLAPDFSDDVSYDKLPQQKQSNEMHVLECTPKHAFH